jgi:periplasmic protein TonB
MPITAKDPFSETAADLAKSETQASQPNATGAEVPVTVHASRYSTASKGAAKLPPIHEETRTVIIFPQGAVVRLSAAVTPGELVVLTNNRTGSDVICRVTDVKTQPGIQNYVHLEFTQRALDFWQESMSARQNTPARTPARSNAAGTAAPVQATITSGRPPQPPQEIEPLASASVPASDVKSAPASLPKITSLADGLTADAGESSKSPVKPRASEMRSSVARAHTPPIAPSFRPQLQPFEGSIPRKSTSKNTVIFAVAAVVLLAICGVTATILLRQDHVTGVTLSFSNSSGAATPEPLPPASIPDAQTFNSVPQANAFEAPAPAHTPALPKNSSTDASVPQLAPVHALAEAPKVVTDQPKSEIEPQPTIQPPPRATLNVGKIAAPKIKTAAQLNAPEPPPVLTTDANSLPSVVPENFNPAARVGGVAPPVPAAAVPVKGGQLQQPKLLSSVPAVYPSLARSQRLQGDVIIDALIDANGNVASMKVLNGNALLQNAATDALRRWKYKPAMLDGEPIPIHINVTITFRLN